MSESSQWRGYMTVTTAYWAFTLTDGAIRMLVVLYFHQLGYNPFDIAMLFVFYEFFGVITNLVGGWLAARFGLNKLLLVGLTLQVLALGLLSGPEQWLSVPFVMFVQALSGIAKDLSKMSAKSSIKVLVPLDADAQLLRWVTLLTGSKNALKGIGFFLGALLLSVFGFQGSLWALMSFLLTVLLIVAFYLPGNLGQVNAKPKFSQVLSKSSAINRLSAARFFLFGARDIWFVVALPVFLVSEGWSHTEVGAYLALWIIGYGVVQAGAPNILGLLSKNIDGGLAPVWVAVLASIPVTMTILLLAGLPAMPIVIMGLVIFAVVFALNSALHSFLILYYADAGKVSLDVGFYYMSNAAGRLVGTVLSGLVYQVWGLAACLGCSALMLSAATVISMRLPTKRLDTDVLLHITRK